jgi:hypothetical protein
VLLSGLEAPDEVATALATSPHEASLRFGPQSPIADTRWPYDY